MGQHGYKDMGNKTVYTEACVMKRLFFVIILSVALATGLTLTAQAENLSGGKLKVEANSIKILPFTHSGSATISASQMYGHTHVFTATATASLPAAVAGRHTTLAMTAAAVLTIDPNGSEYIVFDRASLGAGVTLVSDGVAYAVVYLECVVDGYWIAYVNMGAFAGGS
jgi:hypothetical protein